MKALPWVLLVAALCGAFFFHSANKKLQTELASLQVEVQNLTRLREENVELKKVQSRVADVERLQKENAELYKLRNEVRQLRDDKSKMVLRAQEQEAQIAVAHTTPTQRGEVTLEQLIKENEQLRNENEEFHRGRIQAQQNACINNLKQFDGATEQWALENKKAVGAVPTFEDLIGDDKYIRRMPQCPAGGQYTLGPVGTPPTCSIPGHQLPQ